MKKVIETISLALWLFCLLLLTGCDKEKIDYGIDNSEGEGQISFAEFSFTIDATELETKAVNIEDCVVTISQNGTSLEGYSWKYGEMPKIVTLPVGNYSIKVEAGTLIPGGWEAQPYCVGTQDFTVTKDKVTKVDKIICTLQNVKISVSLNMDEIEAELQPGYTVQVNNGSTGFLTYTKDDIQNNRIGYLAAPKSSNTFSVSLIGKRPDGEIVNQTEVLSGVKPGEWRKITVTVTLTGSLRSAFSIRSEMEVVSSTIRVPVDEETINPDPTPNPDPEDPDPTPTPDPSENAPTIIGQGFDMQNAITLDGSVTSVVVNLNAPNKIQDLNVSVKSPVLSDILPSTFNLAEDSWYASFGPSGFGLIQEKPRGMTTLKFDISKFLSLLSGLGAGTHTFELNVVDQTGLEATATLTLITL